MTDGDIVLASVDVPTGAPQVMRALTSREEIERWWGSADTYRMTDWTADLRVGGKYSVSWP